MPVFRAGDGTELAYHVQGDGAPLVCLPGGPMRDSAYFGDLGGLSASRRLITLDLRGTGQSALPADPASYRCGRLVDDVAALQDHLGPDRMDLLGHSAGANIATRYAARYPGQVSKLALITPSTRAVGLAPSSEMRREIANLRRAEPWFAEGAAAFGRLQSGSDTDEDWDAVAPFFYGRWDATAQALRRERRTGQRGGGRCFRRPGFIRPRGHPRGARRVHVARAGARRGGGREYPASARGRACDPVPRCQAGRPAGRRALSLARRPRLVHLRRHSLPRRRVRGGCGMRS